jgi:hypothetical protein
MLVRMAANGNQIVCRSQHLIGQPGGLLPRNIHTRFMHDIDSPGILAVHLDTGRLNLEQVTTEVTRPTLRHL